MSYNCPKCKELLSTEARPVELAEGETVHILEDGTAVITAIVCDNEDCNGNGAEKPARKKRAAPPLAADGELCQKTDDCDRPIGHTGRCNHNGKAEE